MYRDDWYTRYVTPTTITNFNTKIACTSGVTVNKGYIYWIKYKKL